MPTLDEMYDEASKLKSAGNLPDAVAKLEEILQLDSGHVLAHSALAVNFQKLGKPEKAIELAIRVTELEPNDGFSFTQLSVIYQRCGKITEVEDAMAKAHEMQARR